MRCLWNLLVFLAVINCSLCRVTPQTCEDRYRGEGDDIRKLKCDALCRAEQSNIIRNGQFTETGLYIKNMSDNELNQKSPVEQTRFRAMKHCLGIHDDDPCELAYKFFICIGQNS